MDRDVTQLEQPVADALGALKQAAAVPPADPAREAALLAAFDSALREPRAPKRRRDYWYLGGFAAAAALVLAALGGFEDRKTGRMEDGKTGGLEVRLPSSALTSAFPSSRLPAVPSSDGEFVIVPGAAGLPPMESGTLVRMDVPVSMLPSLGVTPPPGQAKAVTADLVVAQDGLPRAVRLVSP